MSKFGHKTAKIYQISAANFAILSATEDIE